MITDFHTHFLPNMDDGAKNINIARSILEKEKKDNVDTVIATPHFYRHKENITSFLSRREMAYNELIQNSDKLSIPKIILGAEVYFSPSLIEDENLEKLCIGNTRYILLEMPYHPFSQRLLDSLRDFVNSTKVTPVMAHIERYLNFTDSKSIYEMMSMDVLGQVNCSSLTKLSSRKKTLKFIENGMAHVIGTDAHNVDLRPPLFGEAQRIICKKQSAACFNRLMINSEKILNDIELDDILNG